MKKHSLLCLLLLCLVSVVRSQDLQGYWRGAVTRDGSVQLLELQVEQRSDSLRVVYSLPDLGLFEQPAGLVSATDSIFQLRIFMGWFDCYLHKDIMEVTGVNKNWKPVGLKIHFKKMIPPLPRYEKLDMPLRTAGGVTLGGTLIKPLQQKKLPLVVIAHGADNPTRSNWVYTSYAYYLAENGFAVYVFDQRGQGRSGGSSAATLHDHAEDLVTIAASLRKLPYIDEKNITVLGESRGGWVAALASARSTLFRRMILLAGPAKGPRDLEPDVVKATLEKDGFTEHQIDSALEYTRLYFNTVDSPYLYERLLQQYRSISKRPWASVLQSTEKEGLQWWKDNQFNTEQTLARSKADVLAVFGTEDPLVPYTTNAPLMEKSLSRSGRKFVVEVINGLPHGIFFYQTLKGSQFNWPADFWVWPKRSLQMDKAILDFLQVQKK